MGIMKTTTLTALALLVALPLLALSSPARAATAKAEVADNAAFFSADAVRQANQKLDDIDAKYGKQMRVETYPTIPDEQRGNYNEANKRQFFQNWTRRRAQETGITGVFVLICKEPSSLQVEVGKNTAASGAFTLADRTRLANQMLAAFRQKNYDPALLDAVNFFETTLAQHQGGQQKPAESSSSSSSAVPATPPSPQSSPPSPQSSTPRPYNLPPARPSGGGGAGGGGVTFGGILLFVIILLVVIA